MPQFLSLNSCAPVFLALNSCAPVFLALNSCAPVFLSLNSCALVCVLGIACFALHVVWCTLFLALFGGNLCESIALILPPSIHPSLPSFLYFFTLDSSSSSDSDKESLGEDVEEEEEEEMGSDLEGMAPTPKRRRLANASALMASLQSGLYL